MKNKLRDAQDIIYDAWEAEGSQRYALAKKALAISEDCPDAYLILAEKAKTQTEAIKLYKKGMEAGERALGKKGFEEYHGCFWGFHETRPYMRCRECYAHGLWDTGQLDEAKEHFQEMLELNPNDNQGIRYSLITLLIELNHFKDAHCLYKQYKDDRSAWWFYSTVLLCFANNDNDTALKHLKEARAYNPYVVPFLLDKKPLPDYLPNYYGMGDENEAITYAIDGIRAWKSIDGAIKWLSNHYNHETVESYV